MALPHLGAGIGYRSRLAPQILDNLAALDFLEVVSEQFLWANELIRRHLVELAQKVPIVLHGVEMSLGSGEDVDNTYLNRLGQLAHDTNAAWVSDHICFTRSGEIDVGHLTPVQRTPEMIDRIARRVRDVSSALGRPFLLENITYYFDVGSSLSEADFIVELLDRSGAYLLLDVTNAYINAHTHGYDVIKFIDTLPAERVVQMHLAGFEREGSLIVDSHSQPVQEEVWSLYEYAVARTSPQAAMIERDQNFPDNFDELLGEVARLRAVLDRHTRVGQR